MTAFSTLSDWDLQHFWNFWRDVVLKNNMSHTVIITLTIYITSINISVVISFMYQASSIFLWKNVDGIYVPAVCLHPNSAAVLRKTYNSLSDVPEPYLFNNLINYLLPIFMLKLYHQTIMKKRYNIMVFNTTTIIRQSVDQRKWDSDENWIAAFSHASSSNTHTMTFFIAFLTNFKEFSSDISNNEGNSMFWYVFNMFTKNVGSFVQFLIFS